MSSGRVKALENQEGVSLFGAAAACAERSLEAFVPGLEVAVFLAGSLSLEAPLLVKDVEVWLAQTTRAEDLFSLLRDSIYLEYVHHRRSQAVDPQKTVVEVCRWVTSSSWRTELSQAWYLGHSDVR